MMLPREGHLLRVYIGESDRHQGMPLYEWLVRQAREHGLAGATVLRGLEGFGAHSRLHTAKILRLSTDLPIVVEIVDTIDKIEAVLPVVDAAVREGLATVERVDVRFYRGPGGAAGPGGTGPTEKEP
jgi:PII-like signaling protein